VLCGGGQAHIRLAMAERLDVGQAVDSPACLAADARHIPRELEDVCLHGRRGKRNGTVLDAVHADRACDVGYS